MQKKKCTITNILKITFIFLFILPSITLQYDCFVENCLECFNEKPYTLCKKCKQNFTRTSKIGSDGNSVFHICQNSEDLLWIRVGVVSGVSMIIGFFIWVCFVKCFLKNEKNLLQKTEREKFHYKRLIRRKNEKRQEVLKMSRIYSRMKKKKLNLKIFGGEDLKARKRDKRRKRNLKKSILFMNSFERKNKKKEKSKFFVERKKEKESELPLPTINIIPPSSDSNKENLNIFNTSLNQNQDTKFQEIFPKKIYSSPNSQNNLSKNGRSRNGEHSPIKISLPNFGNLVMESMLKKSSIEKKKKENVEESFQEIDEEDDCSPLMMFSKNLQTTTLMKSKFQGQGHSKNFQTSFRDSPRLDDQEHKKKDFGRYSPFTNQEKKSGKKLEKKNILITPKSNVIHPKSLNLSNSRVFYPKPFTIKKSKPRLIKTTIKYGNSAYPFLTYKPSNTSIKSYRTEGRVIQKNNFFEEKIPKKEKPEKRADKSKINLDKIFSGVVSQEAQQPEILVGQQTAAFNSPVKKKKEEYSFLRKSKTTFGKNSPKANQARDPDQGMNFRLSASKSFFGKTNEEKNKSPLSKKEKLLSGNKKFGNLIVSDHYLNSNPYYTQLQSTDRFMSPGKKTLKKDNENTPHRVIMKRVYSNRGVGGESPLKPPKNNLNVKRSML